MENLNAEESVPLGASPSIVEDFSIEGLYGYRTVRLSSQYAATILIAKNGSGKTTLLGALDAFLKCQFGRLSGLQFSRIICRLRGLSEPVCLTFEHVLSTVDVPEDSLLSSYAKSFGIDAGALLDFVENEFPSLKRQFGNYFDHPVYDAVKSKVGYSSPEARRICERIAASLVGKNPVVDEIRSKIRSVVEGVEIVYLPTYRRVELPLVNDVDDAKRSNSNSRRKQPNIRNLLGLTGRSLFNAEIQFGLSDISERLSKLNQEILVNSNQGYRQISANIINELISGEFERDTLEWVQMPDKESLELFFSRLKDGQRIAAYGDFSVPEIEKIYSREDIAPTSNRFLTYFLGKLNTVIKATRDIELIVEDFINNCNRYLSAQDDTTEPSHQQSNATHQKMGTQDGKELKLDRRNLRVYVESLAVKRRISLDALSSGEKQMISLFARLYLYPGPKIVLIDEPELSLSLDWQRKILADVARAPSCAQVIAITHSPFVFDNELEPFAKSLSLSIQPFSDNEAPDEEEEDDEQDGLNG